MKKVLLVSLVFLLTACAGAPTQQVQPTPIIATVLVPVSAPTDVPPPTALPPTAEVIVVTATNEPATPVPPTAEVIVVTAKRASHSCSSCKCRKRRTDRN